MTEEKQEKVIKGLECCVNDLGECEVCPYDEGKGKLACGKNLYSDALALLKAQEPVKPIVGHNIGPTWWYACGECKGDIDTGDKFCRHCGSELKWES